jgi:hypothetical protein
MTDLCRAPAPDLSQQASAYCMSLFNSALNNSGYAQLIANENRTQQYFTVFAIPDAHMETVCKLQFWQDERKRREFIGAHLVRGKVTRSDLSRASSSSITTLGPHVQSMTVSAPSDDSFQVELGGVKVVQSDLPFGENTVHILEAPFVVLSFVGELRREQVWNKVRVVAERLDEQPSSPAKCRCRVGTARTDTPPCLPSSCLALLAAAVR